MPTEVGSSQLTDADFSRPASADRLGVSARCLRSCWCFDGEGAKGSEELWLMGDSELAE